MKRDLSHDEIEILNETKRQICLALRRAMMRKGESQTNLAYWMGTNRTCIVEVQAGRIERLTFNQLFRYLVRLQPQFEILISV